MALAAQSLPVASPPEEIHVAAMRYDMVDDHPRANVDQSALTAGWVGLNPASGFATPLATVASL